MPPTIGGVTIDPQGQTLTVTITPSAKVYTDAAGTTLASFPATVTSRTSYWMSSAQPFTISVKNPQGTEIADAVGNPLVLDIQQGVMEGIAPVVDRPGPEDVSQTGAYVTAAEKAAALGVATLDASGVVVQNPKLHASRHAAAGADPLTPAAIGGVTAAAVAMQTIGDGTDPNGSTSENVKLLVTANRTGPTNVIEQHFVGYSFYSGTIGAAVGTLQGASCESRYYHNGTRNGANILGFEGIGVVDGDASGRADPAVTQAVGLQGSAWAAGVAALTVPILASIVASAPRSIGGSPTVTEARSLYVQEPTIGTTRRAIYSTGTARFVKGAAADAFQIANVSDVRTWGSNGTTLVGYASDGTTAHVTFDPSDAPSSHIKVVAQTTTSKGLYLTSLVTTPSANWIQCDDASGAKWQISGSGRAFGSDGSTAAPTWSFLTSTSTGLWQSGGTIIGLSAGGTEVVRFTTTTMQLPEATNIVLGTATGTKIGTATTQKIGFFNATPIVQPTRPGQLTDSSGGTSGGNTVASVAVSANDATGADLTTTRNAIATLAAKVNALEVLWHNFGLVS